MSELIHVINLTKFQGLSTSGRNPVDNPLPLRASCTYAASVRSLQT
jgi:hypothetical protein